MCMEDTLINTIINSGTIKTSEIQLMVCNHTMTVMTKFIVTGLSKGTHVGGSTISPFRCIMEGMIKDGRIPFQFRCKEDMRKGIKLNVSVGMDIEADKTILDSEGDDIAVRGDNPL